METYHGKCHCGAIKFSFKSEVIERGLRCNCSICKRKGALMSEFTIAPDEFHYEAENDVLGLYQFDTKVAEHYFCRVCGIYPFHVTFRKPAHYRVNLGCIDGVDTESLEYRVFDGKSL